MISPTKPRRAKASPEKPASVHLAGGAATTRPIADPMLSAILDLLPANVALLDGSGVIFQVNRGWRAFAPPELWSDAQAGVGTNYLEICDRVQGEDATTSHLVAEGLRRLSRGAVDSFTLEYPCHSPTAQRWFRLSAARLAAQADSGLIVMHVDVTERAQAQHKLLQSSELLREVISTTADGVFIKNLAGRYLMCNESLQTFVGRTEEQIIGQNSASLFGFNKAADLARNDREVTESGASSTTEHVLAGVNGPRTFMVTKTPHRDQEQRVIGVIGICHDVTERRQIEHRVLEGQKLVAMAGRLSQIGAWYVDLPSRQLVGTDVFKSLLHIPLTCSYTVDESIALFAEPEYRHLLTQAFTACAVYGIPYDEELALKTPLGKRLWVRVVGEAVRDESGAICRVQGALQDLSAQKLAQRKTRLLQLLQQLTQGIGGRLDMERVFDVMTSRVELWMPAAFCALANFDAATGQFRITSIGRRSLDFVKCTGLSDFIARPIEEADIGQRVSGHLISGASASLTVQLAAVGLSSVVLNLLQVDDKVSGLMITARLEPNAFCREDCDFLRQLGEHMALAAHEADLRGALKLAYDDLAQSQKVALRDERMRTLGQMASGIAHDINNAISPIMLYTEALLETEPDMSERARKYLATIQLAIDDVAETVGRMRDFNRPRSAETVGQLVPLNLLVTQVLSLTCARWNMPANLASPKILQIESLDPTLSDIMGVEGELRDALTNLIFNAVDAMPAGGNLLIRTFTLPGLPPTGLSVGIEVVDSGVGMNEATRLRCLEPYFTTKGERGSGLGLAIVFDTVQRHGGEFEIDSIPGQGTTVRMRFPAAVVDALPAACKEEDASAKSRISLQLLLIDDDPVLLRSLGDILYADGHRVVTAQGGQAGIAAFLQQIGSSDAFDAVITDLGMPQIDGREVARSIKAASPGTQVLMLTGWGRRMIDEGQPPEHVDQLLGKPPRLAQLREALSVISAS